ncbi:hypothetical protein A2738_01150 [Candidatus Nomurabacteria bacterium RIFCSPHIGHO2_01_FULL_42_15]|uniref:Uncharacterized protein n=1 Tax=Candidatus Nomurabacteria bacterium RIFCSPHIGHO2_01_FULL_42_15 TaxID=1801742 RepID=A0A1F6VFU6_9BACT|nr:MAG: hypothetical protein A2738_01150 [Candidatus Nomurabacteria bacterium RIFCSPHIGHO2_01_FULL_42_15]OGI93101.1 MAG: hypothetical protein A3A99_01020 [Candidatus Nomurabacteria bacterium RIFCSPLOWO2_01_FULL_41_18]
MKGILPLTLGLDKDNFFSLGDQGVCFCVCEDCWNRTEEIMNKSTKVWIILTALCGVGVWYTTCLGPVSPVAETAPVPEPKQEVVSVSVAPSPVLEEFLKKELAPVGGTGPVVVAVNSTNVVNTRTRPTFSDK